MTLQEQFEKSAEKVRTLTKRPSDDELLELYALYKQATAGDNSNEKPPFFDLKAKRKWEVWSEKQGVEKEDAQTSYVQHVQNLIQKYS